MNGPLTDDGLRVCADLCPTCIFRPGNLMHLRPGRVRSMVDQATAADAAIVCHDTLDGPQAVCRGFFDRHAADTLLCRLGAVFGIVDVKTDAKTDADAPYAQ